MDENEPSLLPSPPTTATELAMDELDTHSIVSQKLTISVGTSSTAGAGVGVGVGGDPGPGTNGSSSGGSGQFSPHVPAAAAITAAAAGASRPHVPLLKLPTSGKGRIANTANATNKLVFAGLQVCSACGLISNEEEPIEL